MTEEIIENRLVICKEPVLESPNSSRISQLNSIFEVCSEETHLDFTLCESLEEVLDGLRHMGEVGLHIMGSGGYIYSSKVLLEILEKTIDRGVTYPLVCFPRTFGLRATIRELIIK